MKKVSAYEIALSAISCAIAAIALTVGTLYTPLLFTGYLLACFALMIPLSKNCYWGDVLAFIGAGIWPSCSTDSIFSIRFRSSCFSVCIR